jgi:hypothetical protein
MQDDEKFSLCLQVDLYEIELFFLLSEGATTGVQVFSNKNGLLLYSNYGGHLQMIIP